MSTYRRASVRRSIGLLVLNIGTMVANAIPGSNHYALLLGSIILTTGVILNDTIAEGLDVRR